MEVGPIYGVELLNSLPLDGGMRQALPSAEDLRIVRNVCERTAAGYEVLLEHYRRLQTIVAQLPKCWRQDEAGELVQDCPVVPGMTLWDPSWIDRPFGVHELRAACPDASRSEWMCNDGEIDPGQCYSTRAAAEKAGEEDNAPSQNN